MKSLRTILLATACSALLAGGAYAQSTPPAADQATHGMEMKAHNMEKNADKKAEKAEKHADKADKMSEKAEKKKHKAEHDMDEMKKMGQ